MQQETNLHPSYPPDHVLRCVLVLSNLDEQPHPSTGISAEDPRTWREIIEDPHVFSMTHEGLTYVQSGLFKGTATYITMQHCNAMSAAGVAMVHPSELPQSEVV